MRPLSATIDTGALRHNLARLRAMTTARSWAVIKADGYGHGAMRAAQAFSQADGLALIEFDRAMQLREQFPEHRVLLLEGVFDYRQAELASEHNVSMVVHDPSQLAWVTSLPGPRRLDVWLKFNSGMNRLGFTQSAFRAAFETLVSSPVIRNLGMMTHFANADQPDGTDDAVARFNQACHGLPGARSMANSAACFNESLHADWVRPGIMLYGASPFGERSAKSLGLKPAMRLESALIGIQTLLPGDSVGYGSVFSAGRPMRIGVVACGYGDGYPRSAPTGTPVVVAGRRTRVVGRVSMDMITVDLDPIPEAAVGSPVQLWGDHVSVDEVAHSAQTIGYELLCRVAPRVPVHVTGESGAESTDASTVGSTDESGPESE